MTPSASLQLLCGRHFPLAGSRVPDRAPLQFRRSKHPLSAPSLSELQQRFSLQRSTSSPTKYSKHFSNSITRAAGSIPDAAVGTDSFGATVNNVESAGASFGDVLNVLQNANKLIPYVVLGSTILALVYPPSFSWFTNKYYAPALGFLMFAVGINLNYSDFVSAFKRPLVIALGYIGQFVVKPLLGVMFASLAVSYLHLPEAIGSGIILVSCVSGAQLSNYATFLVEPSMAPLSIVMTALSTATAVFVTPALTHLFLGQRLPVDVRAMMFDITQIVVAPVAAGLALKQFAPTITRFIRPILPTLSVMVTGLCMGSPLATNIHAVRSPFGLELLLPIVGFHAAAFVAGFNASGFIFAGEPDKVGLQRTISFETGMQSSLLGLALANKFFSDPLVGLPSALSTVLMSLMGFGLVMYWNSKKEMANSAA